MSVLVTHAHNRLAYYATRCLAKHGIEVTCASEFPLATCFFSRYCTDHFTYPSPWKQPDEFIEKIIEEIEKRDIAVLMPAHREGYVLAKYKDQLDQHVTFPYSSYSKIDAVNDKKKLIEIAKKAGIRTPETIIPENLNQVKEAANKLRFPVIIKIRESHGGIGMSIVKEPSDLIKTHERTLRKYGFKSNDKLIIQEFIEGKYSDIGMLFNKGELRAQFSYTFTRYHFRTQWEDTRTTESLHRFGRYLKWHGMIHGQYIIEKDTDQFYLIDINPRFWASYILALKSGVEFPYLLYQIATNGDVEPVLDYEKGLKGRWLWGELHNIIKSIQNRNWRQIQEILTNQAPLDYWDPNDPAPFFTIPIYYLNQLARTGTMQPLIENYSEFSQPKNQVKKKQPHGNTTNKP
jgi:carbamoylphosphate synthase large subunit